MCMRVQIFVPASLQDKQRDVSRISWERRGGGATEVWECESKLLEVATNDSFSADIMQQHNQWFAAIKQNENILIQLVL